MLVGAGAVVRGKPDEISVFRKIPLVAKLRMQGREVGWKQRHHRRD